MFQVLHVLNLVGLLVIAAFTNHLGFRWIEEGHGLHPAVAFTVAASAVWAMCLYVLWLAVKHHQAKRLRAAIIDYTIDQLLRHRNV